MATRESQGNISQSLFISPTPKYALFNFSLICFLKVNLLSRTKPKTGNFNIVIKNTRMDSFIFFSWKKILHAKVF